MKKICIHAIVTGRVQGVFYRENTRKKAESLNITGWVKNNPDKTVELKASGSEENIKLLIAWLWKGPLIAKVSNVVWQEISRSREDWLYEMIGSSLRTARGVDLWRCEQISGKKFAPSSAHMREGLRRQLLMHDTELGVLRLVAREWFRENAWALQVIDSFV